MLVARRNFELGKITMPKAPETSFIDPMQELLVYLQGMLSLVENASDQKIDLSQPVMCLLEETQELLLEEQFGSDEEDTIASAVIFCEAIHSLLTLSKRVNLDWLSTVPPLLLKLNMLVLESIKGQQPEKVICIDA